MKCFLTAGILLLNLGLMGQTAAKESPPATQKEDYSGMYSFLQEGEFVQVSVEDEGKVTGYISRFGDTETDRGLFLDHFFKEGKLDKTNLTFTTQTVHNVWYEFKGTIERGDGKKAGDEAYYVLKGTLVQHGPAQESQKSASKSREVVFKAFPQEIDPGPTKTN